MLKESLKYLISFNFNCSLNFDKHKWALRNNVMNCKNNNNFLKYHSHALTFCAYLYFNLITYLALSAMVFTTFFSLDVTYFVIFCCNQKLYILCYNINILYFGPGDGLKIKIKKPRAGLSDCRQNMFGPRLQRWKQELYY